MRVSLHFNFQNSQKKLYYAKFVSLTNEGIHEEETLNSADVYIFYAESVSDFPDREREKERERKREGEL